MKNRFLVYTMLYFGTFLLFGQEELTLGMAIERGLANNYDIQIERRNVEISENNNSWGEAGRYPTLSLNLGQNNGINDNVKTASPFQLQGISISNSLSPSLNVNWTLFNGFRINMSKQRFEQLQAESEGNASIVIENTIQAIALGYFNVILQYQNLDELEKQLNLSRDKMDYIRLKSSLGGAVAADRLVEEGNYLTDSLGYIAQGLILRNAIRALNLLMAEPNPDKQYSFPTTLDFENPEYAYEDLKNKMLEQNVDLSKQYITQSIMSTNTQIARADRYPTLALNGGVSQNRSRNDLSNAEFPSNDGSTTPGPVDPLTAISNNYFANFTISFTLFNGGKINRAIRNAIVNEDIANIRTERMKLSLERDLLQTLDQYNIRRQIYDINVRREEVARTNLDISGDKYRNGSINSFDFRVVQNNALTAASLRLQALYSLIESHVALMRLTGGLVETYNEDGQ